jgi:hypothetical protein
MEATIIATIPTDFGFWILDFGFWILDFGFWIEGGILVGLILG